MPEMKFCQFWAFISRAGKAVHASQLFHLCLWWKRFALDGGEAGKVASFPFDELGCQLPE